MKVIKVVDVEQEKLLSTYARGEWKTEYIQGVKVKPKVGYLFAYPLKQLKRAKYEMPMKDSRQFWLTEAEVVGRVSAAYIRTAQLEWRHFWKYFAAANTRPDGAKYVLCSSITLVKRMNVRPL